MDPGIRLPHGVRDFLPADTAALRAIRQDLLALNDARGYAQVITPAFEYLDVLLRGTSALERHIFKLVDPSTGEVVALRPDITPQVARMVGTSLRELEVPIRLHYFGRVFRLEEKHKGGRREIFQVGAECIGVPGAAGDAEVIRLLGDGLKAAGFDEFTIDLGHIGLLREAMRGAGLDEPGALALTRALARKDRAAVAAAVEGGGAGGGLRDLLLALPGLYGGREVLDRAARLVSGSSAEGALAELAEAFDGAAAGGLEGHLSLDLGEVRGFDYHSGVVFQAFAPGPGRPLGAGGRYDGLCGRYGRDLPATGFALDLAAMIEAR